jgi:GntR family transcriptional regulator
VTDIDRSSPVPIYHQLKSLILEQIESGLWRSGDRIPTEQELCRLHDISRAPVRQALSELAREGVLTPPRAGHVRQQPRPGTIPT